MIKLKRSFINSRIYLIYQIFGVLLTALLLGAPIISKAVFPEEKPGARAASLGFGVYALSDGWSLFHNQAGLGLLEYPWVGVHHENRFLSPDLSFSSLGGVFPVKPGALGISFKRLGFSKFSQTQAGLAYGMKLAPTLSAGVQANVHRVFIAGEYGTSTAFSAEGGLLYNPTQKLSIGLHVANPTRSKINEDERMPTIINLGLAYRFGEMVTLVGGVEKNLDNPVSVKAGVEFMPIENLYFRTGIATEPSLLSFGLGYFMSNFVMDLAFTRHEYLGYTPHLSLSYLFGQSKPSNTPEPEVP